MPFIQSSVSNYVLFVKVPANFNGAVDRRNHSGNEALSLLEFLLSEGCSASVRVGSPGSVRRAVNEAGGFEFQNFLASTVEVAVAHNLRPSDVVGCIRANILNSYMTPNGQFHLVLKDSKLSALTHMRAIGAKAPMERSVKGKGLTKLVMALASEVRGFPVSDFDLGDVESALEVEADWKRGRDYGQNSLAMAILKLERMSRIVRVVDSPRDIKTRRWKFSAAPVVASAGSSTAAPAVSVSAVSSPVAPSTQTVSTHINQIAQQFAEEIVSRAKSIAKEILGI